MANTNLLPTLLQQSPHLQSLDDLAEAKLEAYDLTPLFIYQIDTVPAVALPYLAEQFHVTGYEGWRYATTEDDQRELLKRAIEMHRFKGTRWSIAEALKMLGFPSCDFDEGIGIVLDGTWVLDGSWTLGSCFWAIFDARPDATNFGPITPAIVTDVINIVNEWKPVRSRLRDVCFTFTFTLNVSAASIATLLTYYLDGSMSLDGSWMLGPGMLDFVQFGTSGAPSASSITSPIDVVPVVTYPSPGVIEVSAELDTLTGNGITFQEFGLHEFLTGNLFDRQVQPPITKDNTMRIRAVWIINYS